MERGTHSDCPFRGSQLSQRESQGRFAFVPCPTKNHSSEHSVDPRGGRMISSPTLAGRLIGAHLTFCLTAVGEDSILPRGMTRLVWNCWANPHCVRHGIIHRNTQRTSLTGGWTNISVTHRFPSIDSFHWKNPGCLPWGRRPGFLMVNGIRWDCS